MSDKRHDPAQLGFDTMAWIESVSQYAETDFMDADEWPDWPGGISAEDFLRDCTLAFRDETTWANLRHEKIDRLLIPLSSMVGEAIAKTPQPFVITRTCIETFPRYLYVVARRDDQGGTGYPYFLENIVFQLNLGEERDGATLEALFDAMVRLLTAPNDACQVLAIDGLGEIDLPEAREVLERYRGQTPDPTLAAFALNTLTKQR
ncbi:MAG: HEAT repeat domain-containing protein [Dehalococcoidia bacterium]